MVENEGGRTRTGDETPWCRLSHDLPGGDGGSSGSEQGKRMNKNHGFYPEVSIKEGIESKEILANVVREGYLEDMDLNPMKPWH